jgi:putative ubiquitin-RnfH superfamily antitoxin RatB of RatAB toxin-antitoxin module
MESLIPVEVVYAMPKEQVLIKLEVPQNTTLRQAIRLSALYDRFPFLDSTTAKIGVFSQIADAERLAKAGDRIEIYRELVADPKVTRRQRAAKIKSGRTRT